MVQNFGSDILDPMSDGEHSNGRMEVRLILLPPALAWSQKAEIGINCISLCSEPMEMRKQRSQNELFSGA